MSVSFPGEILLAIFSYLPRKPLRRLEIVSKEWAPLIKEAASLPAKSTDIGYLLLQDRFPTSKIENPIFYRQDDNGALAVQDSLSFFPGSLMGYCNGVVFYRKRDKVGPGFSLHLYNPFTKHYTNLPRLPRYDSRRNLGAFGVVPHPETNHFKFFASHSDPDLDRTQPRSFKVAIFDSETIEWKMKLAKFADESYEALDTVCKMGGWGPSDLCFEQSLYWVRGSYAIVFCLKTETFRVLYMPETSNKFTGVLWESDGRLKYTQICPIGGLRIWVFRGAAKIRGDWDMIFHVSVPTYIKFGRVIAFDEHLQVFHLQTKEGLCVYYDLSNKKMTLVSPVAHGKDFLLLPFAYRKYDLADLEGTGRGSATGRREQSRKRNLTFSQTTLRR